MTLTIISQTKIGSGSYGDVYIVEDETGKQMAVKFISPSSLSYVELDVLTRLKSPYVIRSVGDPVAEIQNAHGITLELKENCIHKLNTKKLPYYQLKRIMVGCLFGLRCMHAKGFLHNDLVLRNILYGKDENGDYMAYLADFSVTVRCIDAQKGIKVKRIVKGSHTPVEILEALNGQKKSFKYDSKTDIWSLGLCFLEMIDKKIYFSSVADQLEYYDGLGADFIKGKVRLYNKGREREGVKMNKKEELYMIELLTHMLKKNPEDRMDTFDLMYLNFIKTTNIPYECSLLKPSEIMIIPVGESRLKGGLDNIREYFEMNGSKELLSAYFLSIQIFVRIMNQIVVEDTSFDMEEILEISINTARNYYDRTVDVGYEAGIILKGEVGYNPFFYAADYIEELALLDYYIDKGDNFLPMLNVINPHQLFYQFKLMYDYGDENRTTNLITYANYRSIQIPPPKENMNAKLYIPQDYTNVLDEIGGGKSMLVKEKEIEEIFNGLLIDYVKKKIKDNWGKEFPDVYELAKNYVEGGTNVRRKDIYRTIREQNIFAKLIGINKYFEYGIIRIDMGNIVHSVFTDRKYVVVINDNVVSLLHIDNEEKTITHYYSDKNETIKTYYIERGYDYSLNFEHGVNSCCKVVDSCVLFIIFYNNFVGSHATDLSMKCISEETNFVIFLTLFLK